MIRRRLVLVLAGVLLTGAALARPLSFSVEATRLRLNAAQALVEYYVTVDGASARYERTGGGFGARVAVTFTVTDSAGATRFAKKLLLKAPVMADTGGARPSFRLRERVALPNGTYTFRWAATDQVVGPQAPEIALEMPLSVGFPEKRGVQAADIQLLETVKKAAVPDAFTKGGFTLDGRTSDFFPQEVDALRFYTELYYTPLVAAAGEPLTVRTRLLWTNERTPVIVGERVQKLPAADVVPVLMELNLAAVPSGNCLLLVEVLDTTGRVRGGGRRAFQRSNPGMTLPSSTPTSLLATAPPVSDDELRGTFVMALDSAKLPHYLISLRPVATNVEAGFLQTLAREGTTGQRRAYLLHFWMRQTDNDAREAAARWAEYQKRIEYTDHTFANATFKGFETDCGRVYLQYGPPDQIFNERNDPQRAVNNSDVRPYQIWNYYKLKNLTARTNQTNRTFVFYQRNLGDPSPRLVHSSAQGETADPNWRAAIGDKFSGRSRFDRNSGQ